MKLNAEEELMAQGTMHGETARRLADLDEDGPLQSAQQMVNEYAAPLPDSAGDRRYRHRLRELDNVFMYHAPKGDQARRYSILRAQARHMAMMIVELTPESREQSLALTNLEQAIFWANAAIARNE